MSKKVSIVIPTYNGEKYLQETVDSCLNQSYENIEIIVVDDCSTDHTVEILKSYGKKIKLIENKTNQGIVKNINNMTLGLDSDYVIFLGHDDILSKDHIEIMISEFDSDTVAVHCNSIIIDKNGDDIEIARDDKVQIQKTGNCMFELSINNFISSCGMLHRVNIFKKLNGWSTDYIHYGEWLFYINELKYGKIKYTTRTKAFYRKHDTNITNTFKDKKVKKTLNKYKQRCRHLAHISNNNTMMENVKFYMNELKLFIKTLR